MEEVEASHGFVKNLISVLVTEMMWAGVEQMLTEIGWLGKIGKPEPVIVTVSPPSISPKVGVTEVMVKG